MPVSVVAQAGSGAAARSVPDVTFTWAARFVTASDPPSVPEYRTGASPNGYEPCAFATVVVTI